MTSAEALIFAREKLKQYGLEEWRVKVSNRMARSSARCSYRKREIRLGAWIFQPGAGEKIRDTILHEIAHAMTPGAHHGRAWQVVAEMIGAKPNRTFIPEKHGMERPKGRYSATCPQCGIVHYMHRYTGNRYQCKCGFKPIIFRK